MRLMLLPLTALFVAGIHTAQTTHFVDNGRSFSFNPAHITIDIGDTVTWVWKGGLHTVDSISGGVPDGIFSSGTVVDTVGHMFSVTFDAAFLASSPVPGSVYDYLCIIHASLGQFGSVTVKEPAVVNTYGCINPTGSLIDVAGSPSVGTVWTVGVDNPLGTQAPGSLAFLSGSSLPAAGFPCGLSIPGFGMSGAGALGELLIDLSSPNPIVSLGPQSWPGSPTNFVIPIPGLPTLAGASVFFQGLILDPSPGAPVVFGATEALAVTLGS